MGVQLTTQTVSGALGALATVANTVFLSLDERPVSERGTIGFMQVLAGAISIAALSVLATSKNRGKTKERVLLAYEKCKISEGSISDLLADQSGGSRKATAIPTVQFTSSQQHRTFACGTLGILTSGFVLVSELFMRSEPRPTIVGLSGLAMIGAAGCASSKLSGDKEIQTALMKIAEKINDKQTHLAPAFLKANQIAIEETLRKMVLARNLTDLVGQYTLLDTIMAEHRLGSPPRKVESIESVRQSSSTKQVKSFESNRAIFPPTEFITK
jgi:hypothetical protein